MTIKTSRLDLTSHFLFFPFYPFRVTFNDVESHLTTLLRVIAYTIVAFNSLSWHFLFVCFVFFLELVMLLLLCMAENLLTELTLIS